MSFCPFVLIFLNHFNSGSVDFYTDCTVVPVDLTQAAGWQHGVGQWQAKEILHI